MYSVDKTTRAGLGRLCQKLTSDGLLVTGRQCFSLMSLDFVSILLIGVSLCAEYPKRYCTTVYERNGRNLF